MIKKTSKRDLAKSQPDHIFEIKGLRMNHRSMYVSF